MKSLPKIRQKSIILSLDGIGEHIILLQEVAIVDIERGKLIFTHSVDLLDIDQLAIVSYRNIAIRARGSRECHISCEAK